MKILLFKTHLGFTRYFTTLMNKHKFVWLASTHVGYDSIFGKTAEPINIWKAAGYEADIDYTYSKIPLSQINPDKLDVDVMLNCMCTNNYLRDFFDTVERWNIPRVMKILYYGPTNRIASFINKFKDRYPLAYENDYMVQRYKGYNYKGPIIYNCVDPWRKIEWLGDRKGVYTILNAGVKAERSHGPIARRAKEVMSKVKGNNYFQDSREKYWLPSEYQELRRHFRAFIDTSVHRPLTLSLQEAITMGTPSVIFAHAQHMGKKFIRNGVNGYLCSNTQQMTNACNTLINNYDLAKAMSVEAKKTARELWGAEVIRPKYEELFKKAIGG